MDSKKKGKEKETDAGLTEEEKNLRAQQRKRATKKKRKKLVKTLIIVFIILAIVGVVVWKFVDIKRREVAASNLVTYTVERRTITEKLSATGTLKPADSYTVTSKVRGDIIEAHFEEGDEVQKDDVLYVVDSDDMDSAVRQREMSLEKAQKNLSDLIDKRDELTLTSDLSGTVAKLYVEEGDTIAKGSTIADIVDDEHMLIDIPFHSSHTDTMDIGTRVTVIIEGTGEAIDGTVTEKAVITGVNAFGAPTRAVTVKVKNPGGISPGVRATGQCGENYISTDFGAFYYNINEPLRAEYGGEIKTLSIDEGDTIKENQKIITFDSEALEDQIKDARDNLETAQMNYDDTVESVGDYSIKAPITGTVVEKSFNVGESIDTTGGNATVAIIYDLSALTFDMSIDELDIFSVEKGQEVIVSSDAFSEIFYGEITKISKVGSTINGTTAYPVTVTITEEAALKKLLPGMNIDAEITINKVENVLAVPTGAVARGNTVKLIKNPEALKAQASAEAPVTDRQKDYAQKAENNGNAQGAVQKGDTAQNKALQNGNANGKEPSTENVEEVGALKNDNNAVSENSDSTQTPTIPENAQAPTIPENAESPVTPEAPRGNGNRTSDIQAPAVYGSAPADTEYETIKVETGVSDDEFIEIISGLSEGDIIIIDQAQASSFNPFAMMGAGGMPMGGGMPGGGMGGMPSGGGANRGGTARTGR